jgi:hypothetical protein
VAAAQLTTRRSSRYDVENNEILGSGNFDIVKGGTFYPRGGDYQYRFNR